MATLREIVERLPYNCSVIHTSEQARNYIGAEIFNTHDKIKDDFLYIVTDIATANALSQKGGCCICTFKPDNAEAFTEYAVMSIKAPVEEFVEQICHIIYEYIKLEHKKLEIFNCISSANPVQKIVDTTARILGNPVSVGDASTKIVAHSDHNPNDSIFSSTWTSGICNEEMLSFFRSKGFLKDLLDSDSPVLFEKANKMPYRRVLGKVVINRMYVGCCGVSEECTPFSWDVRLIIQTMAKALEAVMTPAFQSMYPRGRESVLSRLLNGEILDEEMLELWLKNVQWKPKQYFCLCVLGEVEPTVLTAGLSGLQQMARGICDRTYLCSYGSYLVVIGNHNDADTNLENIRRFRRMADVLKVPAATSRNFTEMITMRSHLLHVLNLFRHSRNRFPEEKWFDFEQYYMNGILGSLTDVKQLCHPGILKLQTITEVNYLETLTVFLECGCNITKTAQRLYLHRNTLSNRIAKIEDITGLNFGNGRDIFNAQLSLMIIEFLKK